MEREVFEEIVERVFHNLPEQFKSAVDNVRIVVEDFPSDDLVRSLHLQSRHHLLGLYQGIPLTLRGTWYGMTPVVPDTISLYQKNIEARSRSDAEIESAIYDTLVHEVGHYFGMNEEEIRKAGY